MEISESAEIERKLWTERASVVLRICVIFAIFNLSKKIPSDIGKLNIGCKGFKIHHGMPESSMDLRHYPFLNKNENEAYLYYIKLSIEVISIRQKSHHSPLPDCSAPICEEGQYRNQNI